MQLIQRHGLWPSRVPVVHELRQLLRQFSRHCTSCGKHELTGTVSQEPQLATTSLCEQAIFVGDLSWHYDMALTRFRSQALLTFLQESYFTYFPLASVTYFLKAAHTHRK